MGMPEVGAITSFFSTFEEKKGGPTVAGQASDLVPLIPPEPTGHRIGGCPRSARIQKRSRSPTGSGSVSRKESELG